MPRYSVLKYLQKKLPVASAAAMLSFKVQYMQGNLSEVFATYKVRRIMRYTQIKCTLIWKIIYTNALRERCSTALFTHAHTHAHPHTHTHWYPKKQEASNQAAFLQCICSPVKMTGPCILGKNFYCALEC